jgi:hypothetical protein
MIYIAFPKKNRDVSTGIILVISNSRRKKLVANMGAYFDFPH